MKHMDSLAYRQHLGSTFIHCDGLTKKNLGARNIDLLLRASITGIEELEPSRPAPDSTPLE